MLLSQRNKVSPSGMHQFLSHPTLLEYDHYSWSASNQLYLTDLLLTAIEDSVTWCQVFGFSSIPGKKSANASHGKKTVDHYHDLASAIFHDDEKSPKQWKTMDIELLRESVKNRINKYVYQHHLNFFLYLHIVQSQENVQASP